MLTKKLTRKEQTELLETLFGFSFDDDVLIDDDGQEFYSIPSNCQFEFDTLANVFSYTAHRAKEQGYQEAKKEIRRALGVF